jgi:hypothetical protein
LSVADTRQSILDTLTAGGVAITFLQGKIGGEISLAPTERSPEMSFDTTLIEIVQRDGNLSVGRFGILEVQTMDFHGTYRNAVNNLTDGLRLHPDDFYEVLRSPTGRRWISDRIEGPNIANVFKRTFYQMMLKFQIGAHPSSAGCVLALPQSVWDSWQRHLGKPELLPQDDGELQLSKPGAGRPDRVPAWIYVFDVQSMSQLTPNPLFLRHIIATDADSFAHYAVKVAPEIAIGEGGSAAMLSETIRRRLSAWWPDLGGAPRARGRSRNS